MKWDIVAVAGALTIAAGVFFAVGWPYAIVVVGAAMICGAIVGARGE